MKTKSSKYGKPHHDRQQLQKYFGDLPIVEAKKELRIQPNAKDIKAAVRGDAEQCVFSRACKRMWNSERVAFFGTKAYVELLDKNGNKRIERFVISNEGRKMIKDFDKGKKIDPAGFVLKPPSPSNTAAYFLVKARERYAKKGQNPKDGTRPKRPPSSARFAKFASAHAG